MLSVEIDMEKVLRHVEKVLPSQIEKAVKRSLKEATELVKTTAQQEHEYTSRTGKLEREGIMVNIDRASQAGRVYLSKRKVPYGIYQHEGTGVYGRSGRAYNVRPRAKYALRWVSKNGFAYSRGHQIRGIKPDPFLYNALNKTRRDIIRIFQRHIGNAARG